MWSLRLVAGGLGLSAMAGVGGLAATRTSASPVPQQGGGAANGQTIDGITCDAQEGARIHIHQHLAIIDRGKDVNIPAYIGIPQGQRCIYWLHTHTPDGIIHIEAPQDRSFTLGDFFKVWGQPLSATQVSHAKAPKGQKLKVWVDGKPYTGDPRKIALNSHTDIVIEAGPPFVKPPRFTNWGSL